MEFASQSYRPPSASGIGSAFHASVPSKTLPYCSLNISGLSDDETAAKISSEVGQISFRKTGSPLELVPKGSFVRSRSIRPAMA